MKLKTLVIDASTNVFQVGIMEDDRFLDFFSTEKNTLTDFFSLVTSAVKTSKFHDVIFCHGPGKLLGLRATVMFVRVLKSIYPEIKIYSYSNLSLAYKIKNPFSLSEINQDLSNYNGENFISGNNEDMHADEIDAMEFQKTLKSKSKETTAIDQSRIFEDVVCVRKNKNEFYLCSEKGISLAGQDVLDMQINPVYCLMTSYDIDDESMLVPMEYNIEESSENIRALASENDDAIIEFDSQSEYKKWDAIPHGEMKSE